jgi:2-polyprenyl-3-methyl-5-hydroxy-6-metoxy-1,4-benzoquinol methylase
LAAKVKFDGGSVLEIACGTGRVAIRLAQDGVNYPWARLTLAKGLAVAGLIANLNSKGEFHAR